MRKGTIFQTVLCLLLSALLLSGCGGTPSNKAEPQPTSAANSVLYTEEDLAEATAALQAAGILDEAISAKDGISRADFIALLVRALGMEPPSVGTAAPGEGWYAPYVQAAYAAGLFSGNCEDMSFLPTDGAFLGEEMEQPIDRYDAAAIVARALSGATPEPMDFDIQEAAQLSPLLAEDLQIAAGYLPALAEGRVFRADRLTYGEAVVCAWKLMTADLPAPPAQTVPSAAEALRGGRVVHAGGRITGANGKGTTYTNSAEALVNAYRLGNRVLEFDLTQTSDGHLAAIHDWLAEISPLITEGEPLTLEEWLQATIYKSFTPLCLESLAGFMREHPDLYVVTDVKDDNVSAMTIVADTCPDLVDRFIVQIYSDGQYDKIRDLGFENILYTLYNVDRERRLDTQRWVTFAAEHPLLGYTYPDSMREVEGYTEAMKGIGVMLFVHTVNDPEEIAACYAEGFTGVYTDNVE